LVIFLFGALVSVAWFWFGGNFTRPPAFESLTDFLYIAFFVGPVEISLRYIYLLLIARD